MTPLNIFIKYFLETENPELKQTLSKKMVAAVDCVALPNAFLDFKSNTYIVNDAFDELQISEYIERYENASQGEIVSYLKEELSDEIIKYFKSSQVVFAIEKRLFDHFLKTGQAVYEE